MLVKPCEKDISAGGLHIVRGAADKRDKHRAVRCTVEAIGPGETSAYEGRRVHLTCSEIMGEPVAVGDVVYCERYLGVHRGTVGGEPVELKIVRAEDVLGVERP